MWIQNGKSLVVAFMAVTCWTQLVIAMSSNLERENRKCLRKIKATYPEVTCTEKRTKRGCNSYCQDLGNRECKGGKGELRKLTCSNHLDPKIKGPKTCCCNLKCEEEAAIEKRLDKEFVETSDVCVKGSRSNIKQLLNEACRRDDLIYIARKYCIEEKKGNYYCLTHGRCLGNKCKGCVEHECEYNGHSEDLAVPKRYIDDQLEIQDRESIDIDHRPMSEWCTVIGVDETCSGLCKSFGHKWCGSRPKSMGINERPCPQRKNCKCCCLPKCDPKLVSRNNCRPESAEEKYSIEESNEPLYLNGLRGNTGKTTDSSLSSSSFEGKILDGSPESNDDIPDPTSAESESISYYGDEDTDEQDNIGSALSEDKSTSLADSNDISYYDEDKQDNDFDKKDDQNTSLADNDNISYYDDEDQDKNNQSNPYRNLATNSSLLNPRPVQNKPLKKSKEKRIDKGTKPNLKNNVIPIKGNENINYDTVKDRNLDTAEGY